MKTNFIVFCMIAAIFTSCKNNSESSKQNNAETQESKVVDEKLPTASNSQNALDWDGTYKGIIPCADCVGIETQITLGSDLSYTKTEKYLGKSDSVYTSQGQFKWNDAGSKISLGDNSSKTYQVGENKLFHLDQNGERITGDLEDLYILNKQSPENQWLDTYWKLVEIEDEPINSETLQNEAHLVFNVQDSLVAGSGGCNRLSGSFELKDNNSIKISKMRSTMMSCENMKIEQSLTQALQNITHYSFNSDTLEFLNAEKKVIVKLTKD